jgi:hypothetical protein
LIYPDSRRVNLLTFELFNWSGGSPAATVRAERVGRMLEDFDEQRASKAVALWVVDPTRALRSGPALVADPWAERAG